MEVRVVPSIASANPLSLGNEIDRLGDYPYLHIDVEDTSFVPNITFGMKTIHAIAQKSKAKLDAHVMVKRPDDWIGLLAACGIHQVCVQFEAMRFPMCTLDTIRKAGMEAGLAFTMKTDIELLHAYRNAVSYILILSSEPDSEEKFNSYALEKLRRAREILPGDKRIWVDGGLDAQLCRAAVNSGADTLVMGRYVWRAENPAAAIDELLKSINMQIG